LGINFPYFRRWGYLRKICGKEPSQVETRFYTLRLGILFPTEILPHFLFRRLSTKRVHRRGGTLSRGPFLGEPRKRTALYGGLLPKDRGFNCGHKGGPLRTTGEEGSVGITKSVSSFVGNKGSI